MFNVCPACGIYSEEKAIEPHKLLAFAICPHCDYHHPFHHLPLFVVAGASGAGKSTICLQLVNALPECVVMESDILWRTQFAMPQDNYRSYRNMWLRVAKNIGQAGRPVVLCGTALPNQFETCPERRYFTDLHCVALVCDDEELARRLQARPTWRAASDKSFIHTMSTFNAWLKTHATETHPPMNLFDTTHCSVDDSTEWIAAWIRRHLP